MSASCLPAIKIYPRGAVPANLLRWHLFFDQPVDALVGQRAVTLLDGSGRAVPHAFVEFPEGLWDESGTRMTLLLHPGRIKRGLQSTEQLGSALQQGQRQCLRINLDRLLEPAAGTVEHWFCVQEIQEQAIDLAHWRLGSVWAGGLEPLEIEFDRPMDRLSLEGALAVVDGDGRVVDGVMSYAADASGLVFDPVCAWRAGTHRVLVAQDIEDVAGNRIGVAFETVAGGTASGSTSRSFVVSSRDVPAR